MMTLLFKLRCAAIVLLVWFGSVTAGEPVILVLGDSLSAAYGMPMDQGWVALLQKRLHEKGQVYRVANASVSGETTHGGLARLPPLLQQQHPAIVIVELGANDGLRGQSLDVMLANLRQIIDAAKSAHAKVLLIPMRLPPNMGPAYVRRFDNAFADLAKSAAIPLSTFILEGVADRPDWLQADNLHPRAEAQEQILDNIWPALEPLL